VWVDAETDDAAADAFGDCCGMWRRGGLGRPVKEPAGRLRVLRHCRTELQVQTVIETRAFLAAAKDAGMNEEEREALVGLVARSPTAGDLMQGTGGCRKLRYKKPGTGKSGGYRVISWFGGGDIPSSC